MNDAMSENQFYTLTDENGDEVEFQVIGNCEYNQNQYFAMIPVDYDVSADALEYVILKVVSDENAEMLTTIDDEDEFSSVSDIFDDLFRAEIEYDV